MSWQGMHFPRPIESTQPTHTPFSRLGRLQSHRISPDRQSRHHRSPGWRVGSVAWIQRTPPRRSVCCVLVQLIRKHSFVPQISTAEQQAIIKGFGDLSSFHANGIRLAGDKYICTSGQGDVNRITGRKGVRSILRDSLTRLAHIHGPLKTRAARRCHHPQKQPWHHRHRDRGICESSAGCRGDEGRRAGDRGSRALMHTFCLCIGTDKIR